VKPIEYKDLKILFSSDGRPVGVDSFIPSSATKLPGAWVAGVPAWEDAWPVKAKGRNQKEAFEKLRHAIGDGIGRAAVALAGGYEDEDDEEVLDVAKKHIYDPEKLADPSKLSGAYSDKEDEDKSEQDRPIDAEVAEDEEDEED